MCGLITGGVCRLFVLYIVHYQKEENLPFPHQFHLKTVTL